MHLWYKCLLAVWLLAAVHPPARADIGLVLDAKPNVQPELVTAEIVGEGHAAVYLSRICPASPVTLRLCGPDESGSVIQNYEDYQENQPYEWNVVPLSIYLYGVDSLRDRTLFASPELRSVLQDHYRQKYLQHLCTGARCITDPNANWRDSVAAAFVREIYIFEVHTTLEQDEQFIREFNARPNVNHYNGFSHNCADFAKLVVNTYFPHSAHRDVVNDFGMTGPKAIARSFTHYAERHPELQLRVVRVVQVPGTYRRSSDCRMGTEQTLRSKKWLVPIAVLEAQAIPVLAASYLLTGRFNPSHELRKHPSAGVAVLYEQLADAKRAGDKARQRAIERDLRADRLREIGDEWDWQRYRERFEEILRSAADDGVIADRHKPQAVFRTFQAQGHAYVDENGRPWLELVGSGDARRVGLTPENVFSAESDPSLAFQLLLARTNALLSAKSKHRQLWPEFQSDWALLERAEQGVSTHGNGGVIATRASSE
jgi:hypothetical protein